MLNRIQYLQAEIDKGQNRAVITHWHEILQGRYSQDELVRILLGFSKSYYVIHWKPSPIHTFETSFPMSLGDDIIPGVYYYYSLSGGQVVRFRYTHMMYGIDYLKAMEFYEAADAAWFFI